MVTAPMPDRPSLPPPVAELLAGAFPGQPVSALAPTVGGFSNLSLLAHVGRRPCAIKAAELPAKRADLRREAGVLALLGGRRLHTPAPLAFAEGGGWSVLVTARRPGTPGLSLYARQPAELAAPLAALGGALARLHNIDMQPPRGAEASGLVLATRAAELAAELVALPLPAELREPLAAALGHPAWRPAAPRLVHGDAGLHNVLWDARGLTLLDWELAGWGDPRLDLAWCAWTLRFRGLPASCWEALLAGYGHERARQLGLDGAALQALALGQVAALLARAWGRPAWEEWLRRARWSLSHAEVGGEVLY
jgi:aminoglycoside phosphotransferase (APT) family kinase protein